MWKLWSTSTQNAHAMSVKTPSAFNHKWKVAEPPSRHMCSGCVVAVQSVMWHICQHEWVLCADVSECECESWCEIEWMKYGSSTWLIESACAMCWVKWMSPHLTCENACERELSPCECIQVNIVSLGKNVSVQIWVSASVLAHLHQCTGCQFHTLLWYWVSFLVDHRPLMPEWTNGMGRWPV
jgi:hypothetical protein